MKWRQRSRETKTVAELERGEQRDIIEKEKTRISLAMHSVV